MWPLREWASQSPSEWEGGLGLFLSGRSLSDGEECSLLQAGLALGTPVVHGGSTANMRHVGLKELCDAAGMSGIFIPEELRSDYLGDLTETAKEYHPQVLVENLICAGETTSVPPDKTFYLK